ncbi:MAG: fluoride efflux transporter CrcB [Betaproteobacteria bacterium]|nr:MAG: fluoride efflux transporter CrcB [Betaproteobacteria bacterium]TMH31447.1 MAG: fluoride efflux transporter CrcB [Betaproteobacteria bacterium]
MRGFDVRVVARDRQALGLGERFLEFGRQLVESHGKIPPIPGTLGTGPHFQDNAASCNAADKDRFMWKSVLAISLGASIGALLRWQFGDRFNSVFPTIPPGTLAANLVGGYVIGLAIAFFATYSALAPEWRLFIITGFCGGLTTFSTFSAELTTLLQQGRLSWAVGAIALHVIGSVTMTFAGIATIVWTRG